MSSDSIMAPSNVLVGSNSTTALPHGTVTIDTYYAAMAEINALYEELDTIHKHNYYQSKQITDLQKTMDRNPYAIVLIDGDGINFLDDFVTGGIAGGEDASKRLRKAVFEVLRYDKNFKHDQQILIKVYASLRGMSQTYRGYGLLNSLEDFANFITGFNKVHPMTEFIDAGNQKEAADRKVQENFTLNVHNTQCTHIIFGGSTDNGHASYLGAFPEETLAGRVRLLEGPEFAPEFTINGLLSRLEKVDFPRIFRNKKLPPKRSGYSPPMSYSRPAYSSGAVNGWHQARIHEPLSQAKAHTSKQPRINNDREDTTTENNYYSFKPTTTNKSNTRSPTLKAHDAGVRKGRSRSPPRRASSSSRGRGGSGSSRESTGTLHSSSSRQATVAPKGGVNGEEAQSSVVFDRKLDRPEMDASKRLLSFGDWQAVNE